MVKKSDILENIDFYINEIKLGKIFIYPTDTLLGIGCNTQIKSSVERVYEIKKRANKPLLVIIPSIDWIKSNCDISSKNLEKIKQKLPGPYSFIVKLKNKNLISPLINVGGETVGIRIPNNWFSEIIAKSGTTFITTSVNFSGENPATKIEDIPKEILEKVDYIIEDDENLSGKSSTLIDLSGGEEIVLRA